MKASPRFRRKVETAARRMREQQNKAFRSALRPLPDVLSEISSLERTLNQMASSAKVVGRQQGLRDEAEQMERVLKSQGQALRNIGSTLGKLG